MIKNPIIVLLVMGSILMSACATTNRTKTILGMVAGGAVGAVVGSVTTPEGTDPAMHSAYWGLAGAAAMGVAGLFIFDEQKKSSELERQNEALRKEIDVYRADAQTATNGVALQGVPNFPKEIPDPLKGLVEPGKWTYTRFPANTWKWNGTQSVVRECEKFEFIPPRLKIGAMGGGAGSVMLPKEVMQSLEQSKIPTQPEEKVEEVKADH